MEHYHIFKVIPFQAGHKTPAGVKIESQRFNQSVKLTGDNAPNPVLYLMNLGFEIVGDGECYLNPRTRVKPFYLVSTTFKPLKPGK